MYTMQQIKIKLSFSLQAAVEYLIGIQLALLEILHTVSQRDKYYLPIISSFINFEMSTQERDVYISKKTVKYPTSNYLLVS